MTPAMDDTERDIGAIADTLRKRAPVLERLADGTCDQRDLRDDLGVSRSTVYKALQELEAAGLVTEHDGGYALTGFGRLAWQRHDAYLARLQRLGESRRLLEVIPSDCQLPLSVFEHGQVFHPARNAPERPLEQLEAFGQTTDRIRVASPAGMPRYLEDIHETVENDERTATLVIEQNALGRLRTGYEHFDEALESEGLEIRSLDTELPFAVVLFDDSRLGLFVYEDGVLIGAVFTGDEAGVTWGERVFERFRERATPI